MTRLSVLSLSVWCQLYRVSHPFTPTGVNSATKKRVKGEGTLRDPVSWLYLAVGLSLHNLEPMFLTISVLYDPRAPRHHGIGCWIKGLFSDDIRLIGCS